MFKKIMAAFGLPDASSTAPDQELLHSPYQDKQLNIFYNLLFCDDPNLFATHADTGVTDMHAVVLGNSSDAAALLLVAQCEDVESRLRMLAYTRLRGMGMPTPEKQLLGVIVEVPLENGLDTLAAFSDGSVRYLNQSEKIFISDGCDSPIGQLAKELLVASQPTVDAIGPWHLQRMPPPTPGNVRMSFLVSDGLYLGQGPFRLLHKEPYGAPVLSKAMELLTTLTSAAGVSH